LGEKFCPKGLHHPADSGILAADKLSSVAKQRLSGETPVSYPEGLRNEHRMRREVL